MHVARVFVDRVLVNIDLNLRARDAWQNSTIAEIVYSPPSAAETKLFCKLSTLQIYIYKTSSGGSVEIFRNS